MDNDQELNARRYLAIRALAGMSEADQDAVLDELPDDEYGMDSVPPAAYDQHCDNLIAALEKHNKPRLAS